MYIYIYMYIYVHTRAFILVYIYMSICLAKCTLEEALDANVFSRPTLNHGMF